MSTYREMTSYEQAKHDQLMADFRQRASRTRRDWLDDARRKAFEAISRMNEQKRAELAPIIDAKRRKFLQSLPEDQRGSIETDKPQ